MPSYGQSSQETTENLTTDDVNQVTAAAIEGAVAAAADDSGQVSVIVVDADTSPEDLAGADVVEFTGSFPPSPGSDIAAPSVTINSIQSDTSFIFQNPPPVPGAVPPPTVYVGNNFNELGRWLDSVEPTDSIGEETATRSAFEDNAQSANVSTQNENTNPSVVVDVAGGNDTVVTASGNDTITAGAGSDSISAGAGNDSILAGIAKDTVDGGTGFDTVLLENGGGAGAYSFEVVDGEVIVRQTATGETTNASNVEYIDLGDGDAIINTANTEDGTAARQSEAILGRQMTADELEDYQQLVDEIGLDAASANLMDSSGFAADTADLTDLEYINLLYNRTFGRDVDPEGRDFYLQQLADGVIDRAKLAADLSWSDEGIASNELVNEIDGLV